MEDLRITGLVINNVGVFEHLDLSFKKKSLKDKAEIHIFTGENGTGKTTLLEALTYFDKAYNGLLALLNKTDNVLVQKGHVFVKPKYAMEEELIGIYFNKSEIIFHPYGAISISNNFLDTYYKTQGLDDIILDPSSHKYNF